MPGEEGTDRRLVGTVPLSETVLLEFLNLPQRWSGLHKVAAEQVIATLEQNKWARNIYADAAWSEAAQAVSRTLRCQRPTS
jgi:hypothetical protein